MRHRAGQFAYLRNVDIWTANAGYYRSDDKGGFNQGDCLLLRSCTAAHGAGPRFARHGVLGRRFQCEEFEIRSDVRPLDRINDFLTSWLNRIGL